MLFDENFLSQEFKPKSGKYMHKADKLSCILWKKRMNGKH